MHKFTFIEDEDGVRELEWDGEMTSITFIPDTLIAMEAKRELDLSGPTADLVVRRLLEQEQIKHFEAPLTKMVITQMIRDICDEEKERVRPN